MRFHAALVLTLLVSCGSRDDKAIRVGAAASLRDVLNDAKATYEAQHPGAPLVFEFAASSVIARQFEAGADLAVFVSADRDNIDRVAKAIDPSSIGPVLGNVMCIVARTGLEHPPTTPQALVDVAGRIAVAGEAVPAGKHARKLLEQLGILETVKSKLVDAEDVRAALALVESGAADVGIVYATDGRAAKSATITWTAREGEGPAVVYFVGVRRDESDAARAFGTWLRSSNEFRAIATKRGFLPPPEAAK